MKKKELQQLCMDGAGVEFGHRSAMLHINNAFSTVIGQLAYNDPNQLSFYCKRITLPVINRVAQVPMSLIPVNANSHGVVRIMPTGADSDCLPDDTEFYPVPSFALRSSVAANKMSWMVGYVVTASTIRFNDSLPKEATAVLADVVPELQNFEDEDILPLPIGVGQLIIDSAISAIKKDPAYSSLYKSKTRP